MDTMNIIPPFHMCGWTRIYLSPDGLSNMYIMNGIKEIRFHTWLSWLSCFLCCVTPHCWLSTDLPHFIQLHKCTPLWRVEGTQWILGRWNVPIYQTLVTLLNIILGRFVRHGKVIQTETANHIHNHTQVCTRTCVHTCMTLMYSTCMHRMHTYTH